MEFNNRILIVDDNEAIHEDFRKLLEPRIPQRNPQLEQVESALFGDDEDFLEPSKPTSPLLGYALHFALQAEQALEMVEHSEQEGRPYAVIFTDVRMPPGLDGVQLVERLLKLSPYAEIVIITAYADYSWESLSEKFGWTDRLLILRKPFDSITIKQISSTLTKKWQLGAQARLMAARMSMNLVTLERQVEERTARLAQAYKELQNFAYIVSHDLRSPLVSIRGFVSELRFDLEKVFQAVDLLLPNLEKDQQKALQIALRENIPEAMDFIDTSTTKMDRLIRAILKLARLGHRSFQFEDLELGEIVDQQLDNLSYPIERGNVQVEVSRPLPSLRSDRLALEQIIGNLLSNAVKFLRSDQPGRIRIWGEVVGDQVSLTIADNGRGIEANDIGTIFDIFQRGGARDVPGEGMGLTFVKTLLQRLDGKVTCESRPDEGATFVVSLPREPAPGPDLPDSLSDPP